MPYPQTYKETQFSTLQGMTLENITVSTDELKFITSDGRKFKLHHQQDCCESVYIESIVGDLSDLLNTPILLAEEASESNPDAAESGTWTFYKLATINGYVDIRWCGESNGYYSESVSFDEEI